MNQSPIPKALSTIFGSRVRALLMGGQACILYGAAEFSRDIDLAILASADNLNHLQTVLDQLQAETTYVPDLSREVLVRGHACHFRCGAPGVEGLRIDVMGKLRGLPNFDVLWNRRTEIELPEVCAVPVIALEDLVRAKKTQRDKDWPMIRRLIEADYFRRHNRASEEKVRYWLAECRTPDILQEIVSKYPGLTRDMVGSRPLLRSILEGRRTDVEDQLHDEEDRERKLDRQYWAPLRKELAAWRRRRG